ncbi:FKBP-type peptidyl-prolyl cis-trans isomerase [Halogeometricum limi]|uniref:Peptidyl-prolyl cis-trans isomerase n=1 Tax=Halogeometricum limi TaxID=555875 RepID=A0A1I6H6M3_9EURY|nr:FKBP-type peptidyl-prolyl cis-trans isomerase [Halogeometricum limi]SFR50109.1 FKBP-type peptidyl-prolyl cis-trans isomerase [Halogeometricum limi]
MTATTGDAVTFEYTGKLEDGTVFDTTRESVAEEAGLTEAQPDREFAPLTVELGTGEVIEGMEEGLEGLAEGETATLTIPPEKGYGEWDEANVQEYSTEELREMLGGETPEEGAFLEANNGRHGQITHVDDEVTRADFNPRLAGETLVFDVEVVDIS